MSVVRIVQLYPDLLGVTGDRGNVDVLAARARLSGLEPETVFVGPGDEAPLEADVVVIGNGPLSAIRAVRDDLVSRREWLDAQRAAGAVILAVGGGAELLAEGIDLLDGTTIDGLGLVPARVSRTRTRRVGYVVADTPDGRLVGFEDHASVWKLGAQAESGIRYGTVVAGNGSIEGGGETLRADGVYATNVQGPVLPLNPQLADAILERAVARRGVVYATGPEHELVDLHARAARAEIERLAASKHFTAIQL
ncbi:MAG: glutamine amidotransferase [Microbacterium sp.]